MDMEEIYKKIAERHGVSVEDVKREMQAAIAAAYEAPNEAARSVPKKGGVPTPEELIAHIARKVK